ncbi:MAG: SDR family NAD(P)-dependent oxidoreductase [Nitrososphaerales archaeon]|jgi:3-oxoacyl-[acyl-carrier protein] reductase
MNDTFTLRGQDVLITGAGQNVGRSIALDLAQHDAGTIIVNDIVAERAESVAEEIRELGGVAISMVADVTDRKAVVQMAESTADLGIHVQVLINNAGIPPGPFRLQTFLQTQPDDWDPFIRLNLYGVLHTVHAFAPGMVDLGTGRIVTIISDATRTGERYQSVYAAAKSGAAAFSRCLASELGPSGITVNCVSLGNIRPGFDPDAPQTEKEARRYQSYPLRRPGRPEDVAPAVLFLVSDAGRYVTGQVYSVNGGYSYGC